MHRLQAAPPGLVQSLWQHKSKISPHQYRWNEQNICLLSAPFYHRISTTSPDTHLQLTGCSISRIGNHQWRSTPVYTHRLSVFSEGCTNDFSHCTPDFGVELRKGQLHDLSRQDADKSSWQSKGNEYPTLKNDRILLKYLCMSVTEKPLNILAAHQ